jgi:hypothetical protein
VNTLLVTIGAGSAIHFLDDSYTHTAKLESGDVAELVVESDSVAFVKVIGEVEASIPGTTDYEMNVSGDYRNPGFIGGSSIISNGKSISLRAVKDTTLDIFIGSIAQI